VLLVLTSVFVDVKQCKHDVQLIFLTRSLAAATEKTYYNNILNQDGRVLKYYVCYQTILYYYLKNVFKLKYFNNACTEKKMQSTVSGQLPTLLYTIAGGCARFVVQTKTVYWKTVGVLYTFRKNILWAHIIISFYRRKTVAGTGSC